MTQDYRHFSIREGRKSELVPQIQKTKDPGQTPQLL